MFVSDFFDFSIYIDADEADIEEWYVARFLTLCRTVFTSEKSYFHRYASLSEQEAERVARGIWHDINLLNLKENIAPTRQRAQTMLAEIGIVLTERERESLEIADLGLGEFETSGLALVVYINTARVCA
jgi:hypothetical protein